MLNNVYLWILQTLSDPHAIALFQNMLHPIIALAETQASKHRYFISHTLLSYWACDHEQFAILHLYQWQFCVVFWNPA